MAKPLVPDELWELVEPLLPPHPPRSKGGRRPIDDRACFAGILCGGWDGQEPSYNAQMKRDIVKPA